MEITPFDAARRELFKPFLNGFGDVFKSNVRSLEYTENSLINHLLMSEKYISNYLSEQMTVVVPETLIIDRELKILKKYIGPINSQIVGEIKNLAN